MQGQPYLLNVGVADNLPFPVILDDDLPVLYYLLNPVQSCYFAVTRAQSKHVDEHSSTLSALPFYDVELETQPGKSQKPHSQRCQEKFKHTSVKPPTEAVPDVPLGFQIATNIIQMQQDDPTLSSLLLRARERESEVEVDNRKEDNTIRFCIDFK